MLDPRNFFRKFLPYLPSALFAFAFLLYHYMQTGWIGYHAGSPWAPLFERVGPSGWLFNTALLGWRMVDFGRIFVWITAAALFWRMRRSPAAGDGFPRLAGLYLLTVMVLAPSLLLHRHLMLHRYLLPAFTALTLLAFHLVAHAPRTWKLAFFSLSFAGLLSGNAWIYPPAIAQGWDATLAHLPYYEMRSLMLKHIEEKGIPYEDIGTAFPEIGPLSYRDLSGRMEGMAEKDLGRQHYIFYSNIMNDFSDAERESLERSWKVLKKLEKRGIKVILYGR